MKKQTKNNKTRTFMAVSDIHGDAQDPQAVKAALKATKVNNPDVRIINGDLFDFRAIRNGSSLEEQMEAMDHDVTMGLNFLKSFFRKGKENVFLLGNHDQRVLDLKSSAYSVRREYGHMLWDRIEKVLKSFDTKVVPYDVKEGVYHLGDLSFVHGYSHGMRAALEHVNAYGNVVFGHTHSITSERGKSLKEHIAYNQGCLCDLTPDYASRRMATLKWQHGWVQGVSYPDGNFSLFQIVGVNGRFMGPKKLMDYGE